MNITVGLNTASAGSMSSRNIARTGVSIVSNVGILWSLESIRSTESRNTLPAVLVHTPEVLPVL